ncbi:MAG TPA: E3 binding domain-containing protein, partial [Candidatus Hydrogenedentes bacterium]|nr:E3 binding domain-containing protein [Candidatus Hydrogenedentota bacterium]
MHEVKLPQLGQSVEEALIVRWLKAEGDSVAKGEPLLAVQTDKAEIECEAPAAGTLRKILVDTDVTVPVMTVIALLGEPHEALPDLSKYGIGGAPEKQTAPAKETSPVTATSPSVPTTVAVATASLASAVSPRARNKAASLHINPSTIPGTGAGGRVMESDVVSFASGMGAATPTAKRIAEQTGADLSKIAGSGPKGKIMKSDIAGAKAAPPVIASGETRSVPLTPMRRIIAQRMADSLFSAPHYYVTVEIDMSNVVKMRASLAWKPS